MIGLLAWLLGCGGDLAVADEALARGDLVEAEARYRGALDSSPESAEALYGLGWTWHLAGRAELAREAFDKLVRAHPDSALGYKGLGSVAMGEGNAGLARRRFEEALSRAPEDAAIRHSLGLLDLSLGEPERALQAFDALASAQPGRAEFQIARTAALLALHRDEEALEASARAVAADAAPRVRAQARVTRARALLAASAGRVDPANCAGTAPPVYAWLEEADRQLDEAEAVAGQLPELAEVRRLVRRRRGAVDDTCPGVRSNG